MLLADAAAGLVLGVSLTPRFAERAAIFGAAWTAAIFYAGRRRERRA